MQRKLPAPFLLAAAVLAGEPLRSAATPNIIVFLCDNLGYGDIAPFGSKLHRTPHLDRLAREGMKLTHLYSASGVCTPSRAALMTGSYPQRVNLHRNARGGAVLQPVEANGLNPDEVTVAEVLKARGYATGLIGKWHLGDQPPFLPTRHGFDYYSGVPYADNNTPRPGSKAPPLPLLLGERVVEAPVDRDQLIRRETDDAIRFIRQHRDRPFFLILSHGMPGSTTAPFSSAAFRGKSRNGAWGDSVEELDWSLGEIMRTLAAEKLDGRTIVLLTSDKGAPERTPVQRSNRPLGGWGYTTAEGGMRVPGIFRWPGRIPAGAVMAETITLMDLLPTFAHLAGGPGLDSHRKIDGHNIWLLQAGESGARSPYRVFYYYHLDQLQAVRAGPWKLSLARSRQRTLGGRMVAAEALVRLYNVVEDPGETVDLAPAQPEVVRRLTGFADEARHDLGDMGQPGAGQRSAGWVSDPQPLLLSPREDSR